MAAEFAKDKGISVTLNVYDTEKSDAKVASIINSNNVKNMDAVIGPFLKKNVEKAAAMLKDSETPVFSPLSNRDINMYSNFFQTLPSQSYMEESMLRYLKQNSEGKNVIIIRLSLIRLIISGKGNHCTRGIKIPKITSQV